MSASSVAIIILQGGIKLDAGDLDGTLERCVLLFSHMSDKDLFAQLYRDSLSKRLLNNKSRSSDAERAVISKMRELVSCYYPILLSSAIHLQSRLEPVFNTLFSPIAISTVRWSVHIETRGHAQRLHPR